MISTSQDRYGKVEKVEYDKFGKVQNDVSYDGVKASIILGGRVCKISIGNNVLSLVL